MTETAPAPRFRAALVQMTTSRSVEGNLRAASDLIRDAARQGAEYVQTPEVTTLMELDRAKLFVDTRPEEGNPAIAHFRALARELKIWLHIGSMGIAVAADKLANRAFLIDPTGRLVARYDKIHMFDVKLPGGETYRESRNYRRGEKAVVADLPWGKLGITICYDLRFPALYRALAKAGAEIIAIPSAFTVKTGTAHWQALMRARAIETGCWVLAAAQTGKHECGRETYGHSIVVAPWGEVVGELGVETGLLLADIDMGAVAAARAQVPSLTHDRPFDVIGAAESLESEGKAIEDSKVA
ncbi:MAG TPA: carbon-nitrogen hydrolase family protein [Hyphomicrobiaceae bacterium]|nr:carbon-nitrogen hydrolase family protein [Hyphomicrobiaceae bacterium]